jgi:mannose/fructose/N-acetylgalactosamine-specific phosphotransferase system component IIC
VSGIFINFSFFWESKDLDYFKRVTIAVAFRLLEKFFDQRLKIQMHQMKKKIRAHQSRRKIFIIFHEANQQLILHFLICFIIILSTKERKEKTIE